VSFPSHAVIVTAAGLSERFQSSQEGQGNKKEYILLDDRTVLYHAVLPFLSVPSLKAIIVTYPEMFKDECESALDNLMFASQIPIHLVVGGSTRQKSVCNALKFINDAHLHISFVAIHDGARPFVTEPLIIEALATASIFGAAVPAIPMHDALKHISKEGIIDGHVDRTALVQIQTPQIFRFPEIFDAHQIVAESHKLYVDDSEIYNDAGFQVAVSKGNTNNIKITTYDDIANYKRGI